MQNNDLEKQIQELQEENERLKKKIASMDGEHDFIRSISDNLMERLYAVMNNSHQTIILFFNRAFEIDHINVGFIDILGYGEDDFSSNIHKTNLKKIRVLLRKHLELEKIGKRFSSEEVELIRNTGFTCFVQFNITRIFNQDGEERGFLFLGYDLTQKKAMQKNLETSYRDLELSYREIQKANKYKTEFLNNVTHELRTPLSGILSILKLIETLRIDNEELHRNLDVISNNSKHLLEMINQLLDISRIEAGQMSVNFSNIPLGLLVFNAEMLAKPLLVEKPQVKFVSEIDHPEKQIYTDQGKLRQILTNLIGNAIKFTAEGVILLKIECIDESRIKIVVKDTGIGIKEEDQEKVFMPFIQADVSITKKFGGTGLGLTITKKMVELLEGKIYFKSEFGKGTEFTIELNNVQKGRRLL